MNGKYAFSIEFDAGRKDAFIHGIVQALQDAAREQENLICWRLYEESLDGRNYAFLFLMLAEEQAPETVRTWMQPGAVLEGWREARHVYEFKLHAGDTYDNLKTQGIIIGVREGKLDEYVRLHDEQPQMIHDLCYQNGFRKSSIFVAELQKPYLLQFQDFSGEENPKLYENSTYLEWLRVTGECQQPLPGEHFWKAMPELKKYDKK